MSWTTFITKGFDPCMIQLPQLHVSPTTFVKTIYKDSIVDIGTLRIDNNGGGILNWTASINVNWITMSFMSGNLNELTLDTPIITIDGVGTLPGQYNGIITINSNAGTKDILVQINVILAPFGNVIRSAASPGIHPQGIGGDSSTIWHCDEYADRIYELSTIDLSIIRSTRSPGGVPHGVGGDSSTIWLCNRIPDEFFELSIIDFSVIRSRRPDRIQVAIPAGIGGDGSTIWFCDRFVDSITELSTIDFSTIRSSASPDISPIGIGGDSSVIWHCDWFADKLYELSTIDLSVIRSTGVPGVSPAGTGGDSSIIYHCDCYLNRIYKIGIK